MQLLTPCTHSTPPHILKSPHAYVYMSLSLPSLRPPKQHPTNHPRRNRNATHNRHTHHPILGHLIVYQPFQAFGLQIRRFMVEKQIVEFSCFGVIP